MAKSWERVQVARPCLRVPVSIGTTLCRRPAPSSVVVQVEAVLRDSLTTTPSNLRHSRTAGKRAVQADSDHTTTPADAQPARQTSA